MLDFVLKYWIEVAFGLICAGVGVLAKRYKDLYKQSQEQQKDDFWEEIKESMKADRELLEKQISVVNATSASREQNVLNQLQQTNDKLEGMKKGMLSVQGRSFKEDCRKLLTAEHVITLSEYEQIVKDHNAYNLLGGNDNGDALFSLVKTKYETSLNNHMLSQLDE